MSTTEVVDSPEAIAEDRRRIRRKVTWVLFFASPVLFVILFYAVENWRGARAWKKCREELEARGEKLDFALFIPPKIPDEENFAAAPSIQARFRKNADGTHGGGDSPSLMEAESSVEYPSGNWFMGESVPLRQWQEYFTSTAKLKAQAEGTNAPEAVLRVLSRYDALFDELSVYAARPKARYPVEYDAAKPFKTLILHFPFTKGAVQVLGLRSRALMESGRIEEAGRDVDMMIRIIRSHDGEPMLITWLVQLAEFELLHRAVWEGANRHLWTGPQLQRWQRFLSETDQVSGMLRTMRSERAFGVGTIEAVQNEPSAYFHLITADPFSEPETPVRLLGHLIPRGWFQMEQAGLARIFQDEITSPIEKRRASGAAVVGIMKGLQESLASSLNYTNRLEAVLDHRSAAVDMVSALGKLFGKTARNQTMSQLAATACALERHRLATGKYPDSLDDILPNIKVDLISKGPPWEKFKYGRTPEGLFRLYSIGWDGVDDGGETVRKGGTVDIETGDWVWPMTKPVEVGK